MAQGHIHDNIFIQEHGKALKWAVSQKPLEIQPKGPQICHPLGNPTS